MKNILFTLLIAGLVLTSCKQPEAVDRAQGFRLSEHDLNLTLPATPSATVTLLSLIGFSTGATAESLDDTKVTAAISGNTITVTAVATTPSAGTTIWVSSPNGKFKAPITVKVK